jgi:pyruvate/2-oxoglutarate/acetoin dehydrogenase E1 component
MVTMTAKEAINHVLGAELARDRKVLYLGEIVRRAGATGTCYGLYDRFGPSQVIETPVSENGFFGAGLGLALTGYRPILEIYSADFILAVANEVMNDMAKWRQQQGLTCLPITIRGWMGFGGGRGPEHSQCMESFLHHAPGLTIVCPSTPRNAAGLLRAAIRSDGPVIVLEHRKIYPMADEIDEDLDYSCALGQGETVRAGRDLTIVAWAWMRHEALKAAAVLSREGLEAEIIDPLTIKPMDMELIAASVSRTGCLLVVEEAFRTGSVSGEIIARTGELLDRPIRSARVTMPDVIHPYSAAMEKEIIPTWENIVEAARNIATTR